MHYISFLAELSGGTPPEKFIGRGDLTLKLTEKELGQLLKLTDRRNSETLSLKPEAEFNLLRTRLVVEQDAGSILLAVDQTGVVQISGVAYRLTPLEFVHLYNFLNRLAIYHGQEVEPEPRRKSAQPAPKHPKRTKKS